MQDSQQDGAGFWQAAAILVVALVIIVIITVGGYLGGWWLQGDQANRRAKIDRLNYGSQLTYINKVSANITEVQTITTQIANPGLTAEQKAALGNQMIAEVIDTCKVYHLITEPPADQITWAASHC